MAVGAGIKVDQRAMSLIAAWPDGEDRPDDRVRGPGRLCVLNGKEG